MKARASGVGVVLLVLLGWGGGPAAHGGEDGPLVVGWPRAEESTEPGPVVLVEAYLREGAPIRVTWTTSVATESVDAAPREWVLRLRPRPPAPGGDWLAAITERLGSPALGLETNPAGEAPGATVRAPTGAEGRVLQALRRLRADPSDVEFRIEVLPRERYPAIAHGEAVPPRLSPDAPRSDWPWPGTEQEFDAWKRGEVSRWLAARDAGKTYEPSRPPLRLVPLQRLPEGVPATDPGAFRVVESVPGDVVRDGRILEDPLPSADPATLRPVVLCALRKPYREAFRAFTARNRHLPLAILHRGRYVSAPVIQMPIEDRFQVSLGTGTYDDQQEEAEHIARLLDVGSGEAHADPVLLVRHGATGTIQVSAPVPEEGVGTLTLAMLAQDGTLGPQVVRRFRRGASSDGSPEGEVHRLLGASLWGDRHAEEDTRRRLAVHGAVGEAALLARLARADAASERLLLLGALSGAPGQAARWEAALADADPSVRRAALEALAADPDRTAVVLEAALRYLGDRTVPTGPRLERALDRLVPRAMALLAARARDPDPRVRRGLARALGHAPDLARATGPLAVVLQDTDPEVRGEAVASVAGLRLRDEPGAPVAAEILGGLVSLVREDPATRREASAVLASLGEAGGAAGRALLTHPDPVVRRAAIAVLAPSGDPASEPDAEALLPLLGDPDVETRLSAALALRQHAGSASAVLGALGNLLRDGGSRDVRLSALLLVAAAPDGEEGDALLRDLTVAEDRILAGAAVLGLSARHPDDPVLAARAQTLRAALPAELAGFDEALGHLRPPQRPRPARGP